MRKITMNLKRSACLLVCLAAAACSGADDVPVNPRSDPGALVACRDFLPLAEREDKNPLTNEQLRDAMGKVRERAVAANPASDVARLSEQLLQLAATDGSSRDRSDTFRQLTQACRQVVK